MFPDIRGTKMKTAIAAVISAGLVLCACAKQGHATAIPTDAPFLVTTPIPTHTSPLSPAPTSAPFGPETDLRGERVNTVTAGQSLTYTLTVTNHGPADATGVIVTDTVPPGVVFVSATSSEGTGCRFQSRATVPGLIVCELGDLSIGAGASIAVVVTPITATGMICHTATVATNETDIDLSDNIFYKETAIEPATDVGIEARSPVQVVPGGSTVYTLTIYNQGLAPATGIVLTDVLPMGVIPAWTEPPQPLCGQEGRVVGCDLGYVGGSSAATVTVDLAVSNTTAFMSDPRLPGLTLDLSAPTCTIDQDRTPPQVVCNLDRLAPGAKADLRIGVNVGIGITGRRVHTPSVGLNEVDADPSNNHVAVTMIISAATRSEVDTIPTTADLVLWADAPQRVFAGQPFTYTFTITNRGALGASGVILRNDLPPGTVLSAMAPDVPLCNQHHDALTCNLLDADSGETFTFTLAVTGNDGRRMSVELDPLMPGWPICVLIKEAGKIHRVDCSLGTLQGGTTARVDLVVIAEGVLERRTTNTATVRTSDTEQNDLNNTATTTTTVQVEADLVMRSMISGPAIAGKTVNYVLTVTNAGPSDAYGVVVADTLPVSTELISAVASQGDGCQVETGDTLTDTVVCNLGHLRGDETVTVTIDVAVDKSLTPAVAETISHFASVVAEQADRDLSNNEVMESIPVSAEVDITITGDTGD